MTYYDKDSKLIYKDKRDKNDAATDSVTIIVTTNVFDAASTEKDKITVKDSASRTIFTSYNFPSDE